VNNAQILRCSYGKKGNLPPQCLGNGGSCPRCPRGSGAPETKSATDKPNALGDVEIISEEWKKLLYHYVDTAI
jgi:hypothetical protein